MLPEPINGLVCMSALLLAGAVGIGFVVWLFSIQEPQEQPRQATPQRPRYTPPVAQPPPQPQPAPQPQPVRRRARWNYPTAQEQARARAEMCDYSDLPHHTEWKRNSVDRLCRKTIIRQGKNGAYTVEEMSKKDFEERTGFKP